MRLSEMQIINISRPFSSKKANYLLAKIKVPPIHDAVRDLLDPRLRGGAGRYGAKKEAKK